MIVTSASDIELMVHRPASPVWLETYHEIYMSQQKGRGVRKREASWSELNPWGEQQVTKSLATITEREDVGGLQEAVESENNSASSKHSPKHSAEGPPPDIPAEGPPPDIPAEGPLPDIPAEGPPPDTPAEGPPPDIPAEGPPPDTPAEGPPPDIPTEGPPPDTPAEGPPPDIPADVPPLELSADDPTPEAMAVDLSPLPGDAMVTSMEVVPHLMSSERESSDKEPTLDEDQPHSQYSSEEDSDEEGEVDYPPLLPQGEPPMLSLDESNLTLNDEEDGQQLATEEYDQLHGPAVSGSGVSATSSPGPEAGSDQSSFNGSTKDDDSFKLSTSFDEAGRSVFTVTLKKGFRGLGFMLDKQRSLAEGGRPFAQCSNVNTSSLNRWDIHWRDRS